MSKNIGGNNGAIHIIVIAIEGKGHVLHYTLKNIDGLRTSLGGSHRIKTAIFNMDQSTVSREYLNRVNTIFPHLNIDINNCKKSDLALNLNSNISRTKGDYITIIRSGDLISGNWLKDSIKLIEGSSSSVIAHPSMIFGFDKMDILWDVDKTLKLTHLKELMADENYIPEFMMAKKEVFLENPIKGTENYNWLWNCDTLSQEIKHVAVPKTVLAIRLEGNRIKQPLVEHTKLLDATGSKHQLNTTASSPPPYGPKDNILAAIRKLLDLIYSSFLLRVLIKSQSRLSEYITSMHNETRHLFRPIHKNVSKFPGWLKLELLELHDLEFKIYPTQILEYNIGEIQVAPNDFTRAYWDIIESIPSNPDILYIVPYLKNGGAEREILNHINAVLDLRPNLTITILTTEQSASTWLDSFEGKATIFTADQYFDKLPQEEQARLLVTLVSQLRPKHIHIINSVIAYISLRDYSKQLAKITKIFITIFMIDRTPEGRKTHKFTECLPASIGDIEKVYTDNEAVVNELVELMGIDSSKFKVLKQPFSETMRPPTQTIPDFINILWAGRLDRQKRPDILLEIAKKAKALSLPLKFHVYGSPALNDGNYLGHIESSELVEYHGAYDGGLSVLPLDEYQIFLMTSQWEGMPNVILEAIAGGLLVVAPNVGGVKEVIRNEQTGLLINEYDNVDAYIDALKKILAREINPGELVLQAQNTISEERNWSVFLKEIQKEKVYLD